jgi:hypothetical protein
MRTAAASEAQRVDAEQGRQRIVVDRKGLGD